MSKVDCRTCVDLSINTSIICVDLRVNDRLAPNAEPAACLSWIVLAAVVLSPRALSSALADGAAGAHEAQWGEKHMIPPDRARVARMLKVPSDFNDE